MSIVHSIKQENNQHELTSGERSPDPAPPSAAVVPQVVVAAPGVVEPPLAGKVICRAGKKGDVRSQSRRENVGPQSDGNGAKIEIRRACNLAISGPGLSRTPNLNELTQL